MLVTLICEMRSLNSQILSVLRQRDRYDAAFLSVQELGYTGATYQSCALLFVVLFHVTVHFNVSLDVLLLQ